jgi:uncharacterized membrane protein (DUF4010 family)
LLAGPALVAVVVAAAGAGRSRRTGAPSLEQRNPLQLRAALQMACLFQGVMMTVHAASNVWGGAGVLTSAAVLGLTDVDALTASMARSTVDGGSVELAAAAIATGVLANSVLKLGMALFFGAARFRVIAGGTLAVMVVAAAAGLLLHAPSVHEPALIDAAHHQTIVTTIRPD